MVNKTKFTNRAGVGVRLLLGLLLALRPYRISIDSDAAVADPDDSCASFGDEERPRVRLPRLSLRSRVPEDATESDSRLFRSCKNN